MCENMVAWRLTSVHAPAFRRQAMLAGVTVLTRSSGTGGSLGSKLWGWSKDTMQGGASGQGQVVVVKR